MNGRPVRACMKPACVWGALQGGSLKLIPCPTPRWPDLLVAYSPADRLLFTSKLFSAHVRRADAFISLVCNWHSSLCWGARAAPCCLP